MKPIHRFTTTLFSSLLLGVAAHGAIVSPYVADSSTLHLWHFDNDPGPVTPAAGVSGSFNLATNSGATLGATAFSGFGTAGNTSAQADSKFLGSTIATTAVAGVDGAFTFEAMITTNSISTGQNIVAMENNGTAAQRPFFFRIGAGNLIFNNISAGLNRTFAIPITGDDAFVANEWFHVAAAYNGTDTISVYWTRVDASRTQANLLGTAAMVDLAGQDSAFVVGNDSRTTGSGNQSNIEGSIDQVRISSIARGAGDMLFTVPEPSTALLGALGALALLRRRR